MNLNNLTFEEIFNKVDETFENNIPFLMQLGERHVYRFYSGIKSTLQLYNDFESQITNVKLENRRDLTPEQMAVIYDSINTRNDPCDNCGLDFSCTYEYDSFEGNLCSFCWLIYLDKWESRIMMMISDGSDEIDSHQEPLGLDLYVAWTVNKDLSLQGKIRNGVEIFKTRFPSELIDIVRNKSNTQLYHISGILPNNLPEVVVYGGNENQISTLHKITNPQELINILDDFKYSGAQGEQSKSELIPKIIDKIKDQELLKQILLTNMNEYVLKHVILKIQDLKFIERMALNAVVNDVRIIAIQQINNPKIWEKLAFEDNHSSVRAAAVERIDDDDLLYKICLDDTHISVIKSAVNQMKDKGIIFKTLLMLDKADFGGLEYMVIESGLRKFDRSKLVMSRPFLRKHFSSRSKKILDDVTRVPGFGPRIKKLDPSDISHIRRRVDVKHIYEHDKENPRFNITYDTIYLVPFYRDRKNTFSLICDYCSREFDCELDTIKYMKFMTRIQFIIKNGNVEDHEVIYVEGEY